MQLPANYRNNVLKKFNLDYSGLVEQGPINIVIFGDSVSHGALGPGEINYETVYWNRLRQKMNQVRSYMPVNMINSAIGGITASASLPRLERDVLSHHPDLVIVMFGLNDVNGEKEDFQHALETIVKECLAIGSDVILMTPNMLNTCRVEGTAERFYEYAAKTAEMQNSGRMDAFMEIVRKVAASCEVPLADVYAQWKKMAADGIETTKLLANSINHPKAEMHTLFADALYSIIMNDLSSEAGSDSTMYRG